MPDRQMLPLSPDALKEWRGAIEKAQAARKTVQRWWEANLKKYAPDPSQDPDQYGSELNTNRDFTLVERKKADLFYQRPDVSAVPSPLMAGQEALLDTHTQILNEKLGLDGVNAKHLVHQVLFDALCPSGTGWTVMGYEATTVPTETLDPMTGLPTKVDVPIFEECFWKWLSPKAGLIPAEFRSTVWDDAPWLGYEFEIPVRMAKRKGWVPEDYAGAPSNPDLYFDHGLKSGTVDAVAHGTLIFYKSSLYRDDRVHPQHQTLLILFDDVQAPAEHKDSPYQTLDPQGRLTPDSLIGFPIHPLTLRTLTDAAYVPSNCTITRPSINELNLFRSQMIQFRDAAILRWIYNTDVIDPAAVAKFIRSPLGGFVGLPATAFHGENIKELPQGSYPRENFSANDYVDNDVSRSWALDDAQQGVSSSGDTTATEVQTQQANANTVLGFERGVTLDWYIRGVTKYSTLIQRFLPLERAAMIVGQPAAQMWDQWRKAVPASLAFSALPDSALRSDLAWERKRAMDEYTFFANDPFINRAELLKALLPRLNYPQKVMNPAPPEKGPEPTKPGLSLKGEDLNPLMPQFPILVEVLAQCGIKISPQAIAEAQAAAQNQVLMQQATAAEASATDGEGQPDTKHGGKVAQMESLSKHANAETGALQGTGQPAPMGAGGVM